MGTGEAGAPSPGAPTIPRGGGEPEASTRDRLLAAATFIFSERGYAGASVREIAEAVGLSKPALYHHFGSKEGVYRAVGRNLTALLDSAIAAGSSAAGSARQRLERLLLGLWDLLEAHPDAARFGAAAWRAAERGAPAANLGSLHTRVQSAVATLVAEGLANGELVDADAGAVTHTLVGAFLLSVDLALFRPELGTGRRQLEGALDLVFRGLENPASRPPGRA